LDRKIFLLQRNPLPVSLSIVIPAYNEEKRLPATLDRLREYLASLPDQSWECIVVDDGSKDGTADLVSRTAQQEPRIRLVKNPGNRGKGYAVRNGMLSATGAWRLFSDADLSAPIEELPKLQQAIEREGAVIALGSRALDRSLVSVHQSAFREYSGRVFNLTMRALTGLPFLDTQCGFKLYRADAAETVFPRQLEEGFSFDVEDLVIAQRLGLKMVEVPVRWANVEGTKVSAWSGAKSFLDLISIRARALSGRYDRAS
jgi:glycosyltransferase involved in cell wall biosynthesis